MEKARFRIFPRPREFSGSLAATVRVARITQERALRSYFRLDSARDSSLVGAESRAVSILSRVLGPARRTRICSQRRRACRPGDTRACSRAPPIPRALSCTLIAPRPRGLARKMPRGRAVHLLEIRAFRSASCPRALRSTAENSPRSSASINRYRPIALKAAPAKTRRKSRRGLIARLAVNPEYFTAQFPGGAARGYRAAPSGAQGSGRSPAE